MKASILLLIVCFLNTIPSNPKELGEVDERELINVVFILRTSRADKLWNVSVFERFLEIYLAQSSSMNSELRKSYNTDRACFLVRKKAIFYLEIYFQ